MSAFPFTRTLLHLGIGAAYLMLLIHTAHAAVSDQLWPTMKTRFFPGKTITDTTQIQLQAPNRAESGAQVPLTIVINAAPAPLKKVYVFIDGNPIQLAAIYQLTEATTQTSIETRVRMEQDSYIRAIGETEQGQLVMATTTVRAAGGCGGVLDIDLTQTKTTAGAIKLKVAQPGTGKTAHSVAFHIRHPMITGLQRDLATGGFWPAFFINKVVFTQNGKPLMQADFGVAISENPYLKFSYTAERGTVAVKAYDNEGQSFEASDPK